MICQNLSFHTEAIAVAVLLKFTLSYRLMTVICSPRKLSIKKGLKERDTSKILELMDQYSLIQRTKAIKKATGRPSVMVFVEFMLGRMPTPSSSDCTLCNTLSSLPCLWGKQWLCYLANTSGTEQFTELVN